MGVNAVLSVECDDCGEVLDNLEAIEYPMYGDETLFGLDSDDEQLKRWWIEGGIVISAYCPECKVENGYEPTDEEGAETIEGWLDEK